MSIINIREEFETQELAQSRKEQLLSQYHPAGYGTTLQVYQQPAQTTWSVTGYRYSSCD